MLAICHRALCKQLDLYDLGHMCASAFAAAAVAAVTRTSEATACASAALASAAKACAATDAVYLWCF